MPDQHPPKTAGTLFVVATPIGNLHDITLRAIEILRHVDLIAAEDTRHTRRLLNALGIRSRLISYHEHNEEQRTPELVARLNQGEDIALVSDAGTPTLSDPGYRLVQTAAREDFTVVPIPGVSAAVTALSAAGLATDNFTFIGFPARRKAKRRQQLQRLADLEHTLIFYQSPHRMVSFLEELDAVLGDRPAVLARELTKLHEEFLRGTLTQIRTALKQRPEVKGECTLLVTGAENVAPTEAELDSVLAAALSDPRGGSLSDIAKTLARQFNLPRKLVYDKALALKKETTK